MYNICHRYFVKGNMFSIYFIRMLPICITVPKLCFNLKKNCNHVSQCSLIWYVWHIFEACTHSTRSNIYITIFYWLCKVLWRYFWDTPEWQGLKLLKSILWWRYDWLTMLYFKVFHTTSTVWSFRDRRASGLMWHQSRQENLRWLTCSHRNRAWIISYNLLSFQIHWFVISNTICFKITIVY